MNYNTTTFNAHLDFEIYLEGIKIPTVASFTITETIGAFPTAEIMLPSTSGVFKILPNTIVQIFGPDPVTKAKVLLFEGEIKGIAYQKNGENRFVSFSCASLFAQWSRINAVAADALMTHSYRDAITGVAKDTVDIIFGRKPVPLKEDAVPSKTAETAPEEEKSVFNFSIQPLIEYVKKEKTTSSDVEKIVVTERFGFSDEIGKLINTPEIKAGDLHKGIEFFIETFMKYNVAYGVSAVSQKILHSIFTFPNSAVSAFRQALNESIMQALASDSRNLAANGNLILMNAILQFLSGFEYRILSTAAPTGMFNPYSPEGIGSKSPARLFLIPSLDLSPPINCNLFFAHQVEGLQYNRNFEAEASRSIGSYHFNMQPNTTGEVRGANFFAVYPPLKYWETEESEVRGNLRPEEWITGLKPNEMNFSNTFVHFEQKTAAKYKDQQISEDEENLSDEEKKKKPKDAKSEYALFKETTLNVLGEMTERAHISSRVDSRSVSFSTSWNPYRLVGAPAAYIETTGGPSFTGVITSIRTAFDGSGSIRSSINLSSARAIEDIRLLNKNAAEKLILEYEQDPFYDNSETLFDKDLYSYLNIGNTVYPFLTTGRFNKGQKFSQPLLPESKLKVLTNKRDFSIFSRLAKKKDGSILTPIVDGYVNSSKITEKAHVYTKAIYEAIYNYKDYYNWMTNNPSSNYTMEMVEDKINNLTRRSLITKEEYFGFLGIPLKAINAPISSFKDTSLFLDKEEILSTSIFKVSPPRGLSPEYLVSLKNSAGELADTVAKLSIEVITLGKIEYRNTLGANATIENILVAANPSSDLRKLIEEYKEAYDAYKASIKALTAYKDATSELLDEENHDPNLDNQIKKFYNLTRRYHVISGISGLSENQNNQFTLLR